MVGQMKMPYPTVSARVMTCYEFTVEGGRIGGRAGGRTPRSTPTAPHFMAKTGHNENSSAAMKNKPNNHMTEHGRIK